MKYQIKLDRPQLYYLCAIDIEKLKNEIMRLIRLPYRHQKNINKIRTIDQQIEYLEKVMASFERDQKTQ